MSMKAKRFYRSELTVADSGSKGKSILGIIISIVVLLFISSMIVAAIVIINPEIGNISGRQLASREAITLEEALLGELSPRELDFRWISSSGDISNKNNNNNDESIDQILWEENKNIQLATLPSSQHRNSILANRSTSSQLNQIPTGSQQQQTFKPSITTLVSNTSLLSSIEYQGYKLSPSQRYLLIWTGRKKQFRHSFTAKYFLYDIKLDLISLLSTKSNNQRYQESSEPGESINNEAQKAPHNHYEQLDSASIYLNDHHELSDDDSARFQVVDWFSSVSSNQLDMSKQTIDSLLLIQNNDIYVLNNVADLSSSLSSSDSLGSNQAAGPSRLTWSGKQNEIFNGIPDWLYEEEILGDTPAFQVSPDGSRLAYMSFNDSRVAMMPFSLYGDLVVPKIQRIKYPKTGSPNPTVTVHVVENLGGDRNDIELTIPVDLAERQHYINRINWLTDHRLALIWSNRNQNESFILVCSKQNQWMCEKNLYLSAKGGWLDMSDDLYALDDDYYLALVPKFEGKDVGTFKHLARVSLNKPNSYKFITSGRKDITAINGVDSKRSLVYYTSTVVDEPGQRQMFVAELESTSSRTTATTVTAQTAGNKHQSPASNNEEQEPPGASVCVTCDHYPSECLYNAVKLSSSTNYYIFYCEGPGVPRMELRATRRRRHRLSPSSNMGTANGRSKMDYLVGADRQRSKKLVAGEPNVQPEVGVSSNKINGISSDNKSAVVADANQSMATSPHSASPFVGQFNDNNKQSGQQQQLGADQRQSPNSMDSDEAIVADEVEGNSNSGQENLLWTIEDNKDLRDKLERVKAMPLTMRLKVPIAVTNYSANVVLLLPPQLSPTTTFKTSSSSSSSVSHVPQRPRRGALAGGLLAGHRLNEDRPLHSYYTPETISDYSNQLNSGQRFPMVVDVYAGPGSQRVDFRWSVYFGHYLASSRRTIYATIDGRGSGYQGTKRLYELYHRFGTVEIQDQIDVAAYLARNLSFIDANRMAIWGWSYGGYAAAMALAQSNARARQNFQTQLRLLKTSQAVENTTTEAAPSITTTTTTSAPADQSPVAGNALSQTIMSNGLADKLMPSAAAANSSPQSTDTTMDALRPLMRLTGGSSFPSPPSLRGVFECAVSVAPVTNWIYYDTAYTEKYMSSPWANEHYDQSIVGDHFSVANKSTNNPNTTTTTTTTTSDHQSGLSSLVAGRPVTITRSNRWSPVNQTIDQVSQTVLPLTLMRGQASGSKKSTSSNQLDLNERYQKASLLEQIGNIDRKKFLLIHGTADDNVHFQQSIMLMKRLIQGNILYETRLYPDQDHSINNKADKLHLGSTLSNFFAECFDMSYQ